MTNSASTDKIGMSSRILFSLDNINIFPLQITQMEVEMVLSLKLSSQKALPSNSVSLKSLC